MKRLPSLPALLPRCSNRPGIPSDPRCAPYGMGYVLNVDGMELCVRPPTTPVVARVRTRHAA